MLLNLLLFFTIFKPSISYPGPAVIQYTDPLEHGETPTWDGRKNLLYFVDIHKGHVHSLNVETGENHFIHFDGDVAPVIPSKHNPNLFLIGVNRSVVAVEWDGKETIGNQKVLTTVSQQFPDSRMNDGKADSEGRLWFGTMGFQSSDGVVKPNEGVLYKITKENLDNPTVVIAPVNISNGMAFNSANNQIFYIDSPTETIVSYDYDEETGELTYRGIVFDQKLYPELGGHPDGMTIDSDDFLWVALYGGGSVIKVDPYMKEVVQVIALPAKHVTSAMWGGPDLDILFVTTSRYNLSEEELTFYPAAGSVFGITGLNARGLPMFEGDIIDNI